MAKIGAAPTYLERRAARSQIATRRPTGADPMATVYRQLALTVWTSSRPFACSVVCLTSTWCEARCWNVAFDVDIAALHLLSDVRPPECLAPGQRLLHERRYASLVPECREKGVAE